MKENLNKSIELLRTRVNSNLERIRNNEKIVRKMLDDNSDEDYNDDILSIRDINKKLLEENNEAIKIQMSLISFIAKYRKEWEVDKSMAELIYSEVTDDELFKKTISGNLKFSKNHPKYNDDSFVEKLISFYSSKEKYEMCNFILNLKK